MKISLTQSDLNNAININQKAISSKSILPILSGILFNFNENYLDLFSTDLEMSIRCRVTANTDDIKTNESVILPARLIGDIIKNLPDSKIDMATETNNIKIYCDNSSFDVKTLSVEDYPSFPELQVKKSVTINGKKLSEIIKQVIKAVSKDETRPVLCGILTTINKNKLSMITTDSYRLSIREMETDIVTEEEIKVIIPARCMDEIAKIAGDKDIEIGPAKNQIYFKTDDVVIVSRLIEGNFPNYQQLLPENYEVRVKLEKEKFISSVKRVSLMSQNNALVKIKILEDKVQLSAGMTDVGSADEKLNAEVDGESMEIAFNAQYLIDGLNSIPEEKIYLDLNSPLKPGILRPTVKQDYLYLIMPIRIG